MKKTLIICGEYPLPENGGANIRTMNFVRFFQNYGTVDIAYYKRSKEDITGKPPFLNEYPIKIVNYVPANCFADKLKKLRDIKDRPWPILRYCDDSTRMLESIVESNDYDYILVRYIVNANIVFNLIEKYRMRTIIDFDDVLSGSLYDVMFNSAKGLQSRAIAALNRKFLSDYEKKCLGFGACLFCSNKDRMGFINDGQRANAFTVPNIYANQSFEGYDFGDGSQNENILLFVGTLSYEPNVRGLKWFIDSSYRDFNRRYPDARLMVVGRSPSAEINNMCEAVEGIELYTDVPDIKEFYRKCKAVIVPLLAGGGTRIKILEAALANRPVLSTHIGAEGLDLSPENDYLSFESSQEFSVQYARLLEKDKYNSLVRHARNIVLTKYSANEFDSEMESVVNSLGSMKCKPAIMQGTRDIHECITK